MGAVISNIIFPGGERKIFLTRQNLREISAVNMPTSLNIPEIKRQMRFHIESNVAFLFNEPEQQPCRESGQVVQMMPVVLIDDRLTA